MDTVINRLSDIEEAAGAIVEEANVRKKAYAAEIEKKTADFDQELDQETARRIAEIQKKMESDMDQLLAEQREASAALLQALEDNYNSHHKEYVEALFQTMIKE